MQWKESVPPKYNKIKEGENLLEPIASIMYWNSKQADDLDS